jgi:DNA adenine methylase
VQRTTIGVQEKDYCVFTGNNVSKVLILNRKGKLVESLSGKRFEDILKMPLSGSVDYVSTWPVEAFLSNALDMRDIQRILKAEGLVEKNQFKPTYKAMKGWIDTDNCWSKIHLKELLDRYKFSGKVKNCAIEWMGAASVLAFLQSNQGHDLELPLIPEALATVRFKREALLRMVAQIASEPSWKVELVPTLERIHDFLEWLSKTVTGFKLQLLPHNTKETIKPREWIYLKPYFNRTELIAAHSSRFSLSNGLPWHLLTIAAIAGKYSLEAIPPQARDFYEEPLPVNSLPPLFRWAGGKGDQVRLVHVIKRMMGDRITRIVDPFCGAMAIPFGTNIRSGIINDVNPSLINYYKAIQRGLKLSPDLIVTKSHPQGIPDEITKSDYYEIRNFLNTLIKRYYSYKQLSLELSELEIRQWASAFHAITKTYFNGLWRENQSGSMNTPSGVQDNETSFIRWLDLSAYRSFLSGFEISCKDFEDVETGGSETLLYVDPPYTGTFSNYNKGGFSEEDHVRLIEYAAKHEGPVLMNNSNWQSLGAIYSKHGFLVTPYTGRTRISAKTKGRREVDEIFAVKNIEV